MLTLNTQIINQLLGLLISLYNVLNAKDVGHCQYVTVITTGSA